MIHRFLWLVIAALLASNAAAQLATEKDTANGVTLAVTPADLAAGREDMKLCHPDATVPVLVFRCLFAASLARDNLPMFKHILIPTDGSPASAKAIKAGVALAREMGARVTGYHGVGAAPYGYYGEPMLIEKRRYAQAGVRVPCGRRAARLGGGQARQGGPACRSPRWWRRPLRPMKASSRKRKCDVIFIASHGRRDLSRLMTGSVTQKVLTHATVPVPVYR